MPTKTHDLYCRCTACKPPMPGEFRLRWYHKIALLALGALIAAYTIAWGSI